METGLLIVVIGGTADLKLFKDLFKEKFIPPAFIDGSKQEFTNMRQGR